MSNIAVDFGSYSLKIVQFRTEKKSIVIESNDEIVLDYPENFDYTLENVWTLQYNTLVDYLLNLKFDYQLLLNMNSEIVSTRMINLPVKNKKKAQLMLPFQIEEDLPYSLAECHYVDTMEIVGNETETLTGIIRKEHFDQLHYKLKEHNIRPNILTYDAPLYRSYIKYNQLNYNKAFCILEFGHEATRGFFFHNGQLVANHHSFVAGKVITEEIANTYSITIDEATIYKHQNGYVLTENQFDQVNQNQKEFAILMHNTLRPLINEIRRWEIGFRVKHGLTISEYFTCGGTSNINNFQNYLSSELNAKVTTFNPYTTCEDKKMDIEPKIRNKFAYACLLAQGFLHKSNLVNFLKGPYSFLGSNILPLESIAFRFVRLTILAIIISVYFSLDSFFISKQVNEASRFVKSKVLNKKDRNGEPLFKLPPREKRLVDTDPDKILERLEKQEDLIEEEVKMIQASTTKNAMLPLNEIASKLAGKEVEILQFHSLADKDFKLLIKASNPELLSQIADQIEKSDLYDISSQVDAEKMTLSVTGELD